tara:strand:+ start:114 stop:2147 length:2034 start_codon:yes stop_codon:yes gene_type:complete
MINVPQIWISDLTHTKQGISAATFPLGASYVYSYAKKFLGKEIDFKLFKFPEDLNNSLKTGFPKVMSFSNYSWNFELSYKFAHVCKQINPELIIIFGGPNFPTETDEKISFLKKRAAIDFYIELEGETGFYSLVKELVNNNFNLSKIKNNNLQIDNICYLNSDKKLIEGPQKRVLNINDIPSPYLDGNLDHFFNLPLIPMLETTRGCPFACSFCADGLASKNRVTRYEHQRTLDELTYIAKRVNNIEELIITDLNFGMYKQDVETAKLIASTQKTYNFPTLIGASPGKNQPKRILDVSRIIKGWNMGAAVQSTDPDVLKAIKRSNLSTEAYRSLMEESALDGTKTESAVILAMPGDTKEKHFKSIKFCLDNKVSTMRMFQAMLLVGTHMAEKKTRETYELKTKFRTIPGTLGTYDIAGNKYPVAEIEEIIVGNKTLTEDDYIECRKFNLFVVTFYNNSIFEEIFPLLEDQKISAYDLIYYIYKNTNLYTQKINEILKKFVKETKEDLYDSWEEANKYVLTPEILAKYIGGDMGTNELLNGRAEFIQNFEDTCTLVMNAVRELFRERGLLNETVKDYLDELTIYLNCKKSNVIKNTNETVFHKFSYNFSVINLKNIKTKNLESKKLKKFVNLKFYHDDKQKKFIENQLRVYSNHAIGLGKMFQQTDMRKVYRKVEVVL